MKAVKVFYEGKVQGVGFRWSARDLARGFEVAGTIRNLVDGRVELVVCGEEVGEFLRAMREGAVAGHISGEISEEIELPDAPRGFQIVA